MLLGIIAPDDACVFCKPSAGKESATIVAADVYQVVIIDLTRIDQDRQTFSTRALRIAGNWQTDAGRYFEREVWEVVSRNTK